MAELQTEHGLEPEIAPDEHVEHVSTATYLKIAGFLAVITLIEFLVLYVEDMEAYIGAAWVDRFQTVLIPLLLGLSAIKFAYVVAFFMHLKFEKKMVTRFFLLGFVLASIFVVSLPLLFG